MCTLIFHWQGAAGTRLVLGANRDEAYDRSSSPPGVLSRDPLVFGGRDLQSGGTWLALRAQAPRRVVALLNRPPRLDLSPAPAPRSRGILCWEAARAASAGAVAAEVRAQVEVHGSAPFNLLAIEVGEARVWSYDGAQLWATELGPGLHALTHGEADDLSDARLAAARRAVLGEEDLLAAMARALSRHGEDGACRHGEGYGTVSSSLLDVDLDGGPMRWRYAAGPPCRTPYAEIAEVTAFAAASAPPVPRRE